MCGGKGTRMNLPQEKLLLKYKNPVIQHVINALQESGCFSKIIGATSSNAPRTNEFLKSLGISKFKRKEMVMLMILIRFYTILMNMCL